MCCSAHFVLPGGSPLSTMPCDLIPLASSWISAACAHYHCTFPAVTTGALYCGERRTTELETRGLARMARKLSFQRISYGQDAASCLRLCGDIAAAALRHNAAATAITLAWFRRRHAVYQQLYRVISRHIMERVELMHQSLRCTALKTRGMALCGRTGTDGLRAAAKVCVFY